MGAKATRMDNLLEMLPELQAQIESGKLDSAITALQTRKKHLTWSRLPERVLLLRHGQSEGNINHRIYASKGDSKLELTTKGLEQAREAGQRLKAIVGKGNVFIAVSPFERALETMYGLFQGGFPRDQVRVVHHDPRIRWALIFLHCKSDHFF